MAEANYFENVVEANITEDMILMVNPGGLEAITLKFEQTGKTERRLLVDPKKCMMLVNVGRPQV